MMQTNVSTVLAHDFTPKLKHQLIIKLVYDNIRKTTSNYYIIFCICHTIFSHSSATSLKLLLRKARSRMRNNLDQNKLGKINLFFIMEIIFQFPLDKTGQTVILRSLFDKLTLLGDNNNIFN